MSPSSPAAEAGLHENDAVLLFDTLFLSPIPKQHKNQCTQQNNSTKISSSANLSSSSSLQEPADDSEDSDAEQQRECARLLSLLPSVVAKYTSSSSSSSALRIVVLRSNNGKLVQLLLHLHPHKWGGKGLLGFVFNMFFIFKSESRQDVSMCMYECAI